MHLNKHHKYFGSQTVALLSNKVQNTTFKYALFKIFTKKLTFLIKQISNEKYQNEQKLLSIST